ncbi:MAG TPA: class I SAM-dependent methyltransferase [Steroidobacteraceae bacterium]|jgi:2-polyprenyl-3-methyl-5-hydroxy-6-metoxy-1,4-benzoquinol methylase
MALPAVDQARLIDELLGTLIAELQPESIAIIGCAGGNGFERCKAAGLRRVVGIDINGRYIEIARRRFEKTVPGLELHVADLQLQHEIFKPVDFLYVALVLEYVDLHPALTNLRRHCNTLGMLATLTQMPHSTLKQVSTTPYTSLLKLSDVMKLVDAAELVRQAAQLGFLLQRESTIASSAGKQFKLHVFELGGAGPRNSSSKE